MQANYYYTAAMFCLYLRNYEGAAYLFEAFHSDVFGL